MKGPPPIPMHDPTFRQSTKPAPLPPSFSFSSLHYRGARICSTFPCLQVKNYLWGGKEIVNCNPVCFLRSESYWTQWDLPPSQHAQDCSYAHSNAVFFNLQ